jgi:hypothetical protein
VSATPATGRTWPALFVGLLAGVAALFLMAPTDFILLRSPAVLGPAGDMAQALGGAIAYVADGWRFPLFDIGNVMTDGRQNIIFTDSIPAYALLWKLYSHLAEPDFRFYLPAFVVFTILMQGVSAALLLRWLGVTSVVALFAGALLFAVWPIFLFRFMMQHLALTSHWLILFGIGLLLTAPLAGPSGRRNLVLWSALVVLSLLIHGYFFAFTTALFVGRLAIDRFAPTDGSGLGNRQAIVDAAIFLGLSALVMVVSGHVGGPRVVSEGFGYYSLNLAAPVIPAHLSLFVPNWMPFPLGQAEGYNYIPMAGFVLIAVALVDVVSGPGRRDASRRLSRGGIWAVALLALAFTAFAASNQIWFAGSKVASYTVPSFALGIVGTFRSSGRFFWVVSYLVLALSIAAVSTRLPRLFGDMLLVLVAIGATVEMTPLRHLTVPVVGEYASDPAFVAVMVGEKSASVYPPYPCNPEPTAVIPHQIQLLAARTGVLMENGFVSARPGKACPDGIPASIAPKPQPGHIVFLLGAELAIPALGQLGIEEGACRQRRDIIVCLADWTGKPQADFFEPKPSLVAPPARFTFFGDSPGAKLLSAGFSGAEPWGTWSVGRESHIVLPLNPQAAGPSGIRLDLAGFVPAERPSETVRVSLSSRPSRAAEWIEESATEITLTETEPRTTVTLARPATPAESIRVTLSVADAVSPQSLGIGDDERQLGVAVFELSVE